MTLHPPIAPNITAAGIPPEMRLPTAAANDSPPNPISPAAANRGQYSARAIIVIG